MNKGFGFLILLIVILNGCTSKTTDKTISANNDSIRKYLDLAGNDTLVFDKRVKYNDKALSFVDLEKNDSLTREYLNSVVYNYLMTRDSLKFKKHSSFYFEKVTQQKDTLGLARFYRYKGIYCKNMDAYDSSFYFYLKSEKLYKKTYDDEGLARVYLSKATVQNQMNDYLGAELSIKKASIYFRDKKNLDYYKCLVILGNVYLDLKEYDKAIIKFNESLALLKKYNLHNTKNDNLLGISLNNLGNVYKEQKKYLKAISYFKLALKENDLLEKDPSLYGYLVNNLGFCYLKTNYNQKLPNLFYKADKIFDSLKIKNERSIVNLNLSEFYLREKDSIKAQFYIEKALRLAKESGAPYYYLNALSNAGNINSKKASKYIKIYHAINDSIIFAERNARNQYFKIQLETNEITQQKNTAVKQKSIVIAIAFTLFIISILIFIIARQRIKQKELRLYQTQQKTNEEIYQLMLRQETKEEKVRQMEKKRIGLELHDGIMNKLASARLNLSILTISRDEKTINKCLTSIKDIQNIEKEIRNVAHNLNKETVDDFGSFRRLLKNFVEEQNTISITVFKIEVDETIDWNVVSNNTKMNLYRIIQEASHNIHKHANAKIATINLLVDAENIYLTITDDGIGFNSRASERGIGLKNMKYRVELLKGKFNIKSKPNSATSINIIVPLKELD